MSTSALYTSAERSMAFPSFFSKDIASVTPAIFKSNIPQPEPLCIAPGLIFGDCEQSSSPLLSTDLESGSQFGSPYVPFVTAFGNGDTLERYTTEDSYYDALAAELSQISGLEAPTTEPSTLTPAMGMMSLSPDTCVPSPIPPLPALPNDGLSSLLLFSGPQAAVPAPSSILPQAASPSASSTALMAIAQMRALLEAQLSCAIEDDYEDGQGCVPEGELFGYASGGSTPPQPPARAHRSGRAYSFPTLDRSPRSPPRKKGRALSCSDASPKMYARTSSRKPRVGPKRTSRTRSKSPATARGERAPRNHQCALVFGPGDEVVYPEPNGPCCPVCDYVQRTVNGTYKLQELKRHIESHFTAGLRKRGRSTKCCGVPVKEAHKYKVPPGAEVTVHKTCLQDGGTIEMIGGCGAVFARKDAYNRHLRDQGCLGDFHGWWLNILPNKL